MRWVARRQSENVEDRRGMGGRGVAVGGGAVNGLVTALTGADGRLDLDGLLEAAKDTGLDIEKLKGLIG
jgi:uncharacterized protein